jgi:hypothetical protein
MTTPINLNYSPAHDVKSTTGTVTRGHIIVE